MELSRRRFSSGALLAALISALPLALTSCGIFPDIVAWTSVAGLALDGIAAVLGPLMPPGGAAAILALKALLTDLAGAVSQYENDTNPADKATLLAKIRTLLVAIAVNFQTFLGKINLGTDPITNLILGLAQVILAAITGFLGELPMVSTKIIGSTVTIGAKTLAVVPKYYKRVSEFKKDYNAVCVAHGDTEIEIH